MPARVWVLSSAIIGLGVLAFIVLVTAVPDPAALIGPGPAASAPAVAEAPPEPAGPSPELMAAVAATASARQSVLPATHVPVPGGPTVLTLVTAAENQLTFAYEVEIDPAEYVLPADPTELFPGLDAHACTANPPRVCYDFTPAFAADVCADPELRGLLDRGAIVRALFRDINRRPLADTAVLVAACV